MTTVLFIEDEIGSMTWATDLIESKGYETEIVSSEYEANKLIQEISTGKRQYALAVIDVMIPILPFEKIVEVDESFLRDSETTGLRICTKIRQELKISKEELPIVCITGRSDEAEISEEIKKLKIDLFSRSPRHSEHSLRKYIEKMPSLHD